MGSMVEVIRTVSEMHRAADAIRLEGLRIGLVPTMGYLHEGHLSLVHRALKETDRVVVSIFVNPKQFGPQEDLAAYPRDLDRDLALIAEAGAQVAYVPEVSEMYPKGYATYVDVDELADGLCGRSRPGHFRGVTTIVTKLFAAVKPHVAVFGQKDAQQALILKRLARDLNLDVDVVMAPTAREPDGLAKSSRNVYLSAQEREQAPVLYQALEMAGAMVADGERRAAVVLGAVRDLIGARSQAEIDYVEAVDTDRLAPVEALSGPVLLALAAKFGKARLIDNVILDVP